MSFLIENLSFRYPKNEFATLSNVTMEIPDCERVCVLGASGSGKTTLMSLLGLLIDRRQIEGQITYHDGGQTFQYSRLEVGVPETLRRCEFGFAFQNSYLFPHLTAIENLAFPLGLLGIGSVERISRAEALLDRMNMLECRDRLPTEISGGQKQRVAVLRSLIHSPRVVFADEPFSALNDETRDLILEVLRSWHQGDLGLPDQGQQNKLLFLVCHDENVAAQIGTSEIRFTGSQVNFKSKVEA